MHKPALPTLSALAVGLACAGLLLWIALHRGGEPGGPTPAPARPATATPARPPAATAPGDSLAARLADLQPWIAALQRALARREARPDEAVLAFKDDAALQRFLARAGRAGLTVLGQSSALRSVRVRFDALGALQQDLAAHADDYADLAANHLFGVPQRPAREARADVEQFPFRNETLAYLGATGDRSGWGRGTLIAILDTGVGGDATFGAGRVRALDIGLGLAPGRGPDDGHGTSVAALAAGAAADAAGVAPGAGVLSIRVTDASGLSDLFTLAQAIVAATDAGARVINISLGGYSTGAALEAAIGYAQQRGSVIVAAAGNDQAAQLAWPAADPRVISVGAIDRAEQQVTFSNSSAGLQLTAPGYGVQTAWVDGQRAYVDGTSAAAPLVSGALAALLGQNPNLTATQAAAVLLATASDGGAPGADPAFGRGILNVGWAMNQGSAGYVDTAIATHYYDAGKQQLQFVVQNRSGRAITGLILNVTSGTTTAAQTVPSLSPGEAYVATLPVSDVALRTAGTLKVTTQLANPLGVTDQVPANNVRSSVLTAPARQP